jgi:hypothetical protein
MQGEDKVGRERRSERGGGGLVRLLFEEHRICLDDCGRRRG